MNFQCPKCSTGHEVDEVTLSLTGGEIVCSTCGHVFSGQQGPEDVGAMAASTVVDDVPEIPTRTGPEASVVGRLKGVTVLGASGQEQEAGERYYVQRKSGKVFGPFEKTLIRQMIDGGKLSGSEGISKDKSVWIPILSVSDFASLFRDRSADANPETQPLDFHKPPGSSVDHLRPASNVFGSPEASGFSITGLLNEDDQTATENPFANTNLSDPNLFGVPGGQEAQSPKLPSLKDVPMPDPVDFDMSDFPGLQTGTFGKPDASPSGQRSGGLPSSFSDSLPVPKSGAFANSDSLPELPRPKSAPGFTSNLPELPRPKSAGDVSSPTTVPELPRPKSGVDFASYSSLPELPRPKSGSHMAPVTGAELPRPGRSGLPTPSYGGAGSELPSAPAGKGLPTRKLDFDSLPLASGGQTPSEKKGLPTRRYDTELGAEFSSPLEFAGTVMPGSQADESLPLPTDDFTASGINLDFDASTMPLPSDTIPDSRGGLGDFSLDQPLEPTPKLPDTPHRPSVDKKKDKAATKTKDKREKKKREIRTKKASNKMRVYALGVLGIIGVGVLGVSLLGGDDGDNADETRQNPLSNQDEVMDVVAVNPPELSLLFPGTFGDYAAFLEEATQAANTNQNQETASVAHLVIGQALMAIQYQDDAQGAADIAARAGFLGDPTDPLQALARGAEQARQGNLDQALALLEPLYLGEDGHWAHLFTGLAEVQRFRRAVAEYEEHVPLVEEATGQGSETEGQEIEPEGEEETSEAPEDAEAEPSDGAEIAEEPALEDAPVEPMQPPTLNPLAVQSFETAARLEPRLAAPRYFLGVCAELSQGPEAAAAIYAEAVDVFPEHIPSQLALSRLLVEAGRFEDASSRLALLADRRREETTATERSDTFYLLGTAALTRRRFDRAVEAFQQALLEVKGNDAALWDYVNVQNRLGHFTNGLTFLSDRVGRGDQDGEFILARGLLQAGKANASAEPNSDTLRASYEVINNGRAQAPDDPRFPFMLGRIRQADGRFDLAEEQYEAALAIDPDFREARLSLVELNEMRSDTEGARTQLQEASERGEPSAELETKIGEAWARMGEPAAAAEHYRLAIEIDPYALDARLALSDFLIGLGELEHLQTALAQLQWVEEVGVDEEKLHSLFAHVYYGLGDLESASQRMDRVTADIEDEIRNPDHLYLIGRINFDRGMIAAAAGNAAAAQERFQTAETSFAAAFDHGRHSSDSRYWQGRSLLALENYSEADRTLRRAIELGNQEGALRGEYYYWLGDTLERGQSAAQALSAYREVDRVDLRWALANPELFYRRGRLNHAYHHRLAAEQDFRWILMLEPRRADVSAALARVYTDLRDFDKAIAFFLRSLDLAQEQPAVHTDLGMLYNRLERNELALRHLEIAKGAGYGAVNPMVHRTLGYLYRDSDRFAEAIEDLRQYLEYARPEDDSPERLEIEVQIRRLEQGQR